MLMLMLMVMLMLMLVMMLNNLRNQVVSSNDEADIDKADYENDDNDVGNYAFVLMMLMIIGRKGGEGEQTRPSFHSR